MISPFLVCALTFLLLLPWGSWVVDQLLRRGIGKRIRVDGLPSHQAKEGTATMGGLYILAGIGVITVVLAISGHTETILPLVCMLCFGLLGAFDDLQGLKDGAGVGWLARFKFPWQWGLAVVLAAAMYLFPFGRPAVTSLFGCRIDMGWCFIPIAAFLLVALSNAVNIADGQDGLAGGASALAFLAYGCLTWLTGQPGLALFCFALVGALMAFLWFNVHPARMFMGDTGSQALGAGLAAVGMLSGYWVLLPLVGVVFVADAISVVVQVGYFKYTRARYGEGRRVFLIAPLHHHYEKTGLPEVQITSRFLLVAAVAGALSVGLGVGW